MGGAGEDRAGRPAAHHPADPAGAGDVAGGRVEGAGALTLSRHQPGHHQGDQGDRGQH